MFFQQTKLDVGPLNASFRSLMVKREQNELHGHRLDPWKPVKREQEDLREIEKNIQLNNDFTSRKISENSVQYPQAFVLPLFGQFFHQIEL